MTRTASVLAAVPPVRRHLFDVPGGRRRQRPVAAVVRAPRFDDFLRCGILAHGCCPPARRGARRCAARSATASSGRVHAVIEGDARQICGSSNPGPSSHDAAVAGRWPDRTLHGGGETLANQPLHSDGRGSTSKACRPREVSMNVSRSRITIRGTAATAYARSFCSLRPPWRRSSGSRSRWVQVAHRIEPRRR